RSRTAWFVFRSLLGSRMEQSLTAYTLRWTCPTTVFECGPRVRIRPLHYLYARRTQKVCDTACRFSAQYPTAGDKPTDPARSRRRRELTGTSLWVPCGTLPPTTRRCVSSTR